MYGGNSRLKGPAGAGSQQSSQQRRFEVMQKRPENRLCFDCGCRQPRWGSTNLGIFFCLRCAGIHRSLGTHISKVKSTNMDAWEEGMMNLIEHVGNTRGRLLYEYNMPERERPNSNTDPITLERLLRNKYERKAYYHPHFDELMSKFMATDIEVDVSSAQATTQQAQPTAQQQQQQPKRQQPAAAPPVEELWGGPVTAPSPPQHNALAASPSSASGADIADLFSQQPCAPQHPQPIGGWMQTSPATTGMMYQSPPSAGPAYTNAAVPSAWPPAPHHPGGYAVNGSGSPHSPEGVGMFAGSSSPPTNQHNHNHHQAYHNYSNTAASPKEEIMSLFAPPPPSANCTYGAWKPQETRPYYYPEH